MINAVKTGGHISCYQLKFFFTFRLFNSALVLTKIKQFAQQLLSGNLSLPFFFFFFPEAFLISSVLFVLIIIVVIILLTVILRGWWFFSGFRASTEPQRSRDRTLGLQSVLESLRLAQRAEIR